MLHFLYGLFTFHVRPYTMWKMRRHCMVIFVHFCVSNVNFIFCQCVHFLFVHTVGWHIFDSLIVRLKLNDGAIMAAYLSVSEDKLANVVLFFAFLFVFKIMLSTVWCYEWKFTFLSWLIWKFINLKYLSKVNLRMLKH